MWKPIQKMFKSDSRFNKFLVKHFGRRIIYQKGIFYDQNQQVKYTCEQCKKGIWDLPSVSGRNYVYKLVDPFPITEIVELTDQNIQIYGWAVEYKWGDHPGWYSHWNHKIYDSKDKALDVVNRYRMEPETRTYSYKLGGIESRISPLYRADSGFYRNHVLHNILRDDETVESAAKLEVKFYRLKDNYVAKHSKHVYKKDKVFAKICESNRKYERVWMLATPTHQRGTGYYGNVLKEMIELNVVEEIDIKKTNLQPHLHKEVKKYLN